MQAWRLANPEKMHAAQAAWRAANPEQRRAAKRQWDLQNRAHIRAYQRKYNQENNEAVLAWRKLWRIANPARVATHNRRFAQANPVVIRAIWHRRKARKMKASLALFPVTADVIAERLALTDGCCYCGQDKPLETEHVVALNDGGWHVPSNILGACRSCNSSKQDSPVEQWFRAQPFFSEERWQKIQELTND